MESKKIGIYTSITLGKNYCWYCGTELYPSNKTLDHFFPKSMGGKLTVACCSGCNKMKANLIPNDFIKLLKLKKAKHQKNQPWQKKFDVMINATEKLWEQVKDTAE